MATLRIYCMRYWHRDQGQCLSWFSNKAEAERALRRMIRENGESQGPSGVEPIEFPLTKTALLDWLNHNFNRDNG